MKQMLLAICAMGMHWGPSLTGYLKFLHANNCSLCLPFFVYILCFPFVYICKGPLKSYCTHGSWLKQCGSLVFAVPPNHHRQWHSGCLPDLRQLGQFTACLFQLLGLFWLGFAPNCVLVAIVCLGSVVYDLYVRERCGRVW